MRLTILGKGTLYPRNNAGGPGYLLETGKIGNSPILFDTGLGTLHKLAKLGVDVRKIRHIFYTHTHNDHICELAPILWYLKFLSSHRPKDPVNKEININLYGPKGFKEYFNDLWFKILGSEEPAGFIASVNELESDEFAIDDLRIKSRPVVHKGDCLGFRVEQDDKVFVYSGDTSMCEGVKKLSADADLLLLECAFPKGTEVIGHMNTIECGKLAKDAHAKRLVLAHRYPETLAIDAKKECAEEFDGDIIVPEDLMAIDI